MSVKIKKVNQSSFAEEIGLEDNDIILKINGKDIADFLDVSFYSADEKLAIEVLRGKKKLVISGEKETEEPLGIELEDHTCRECVNNCIFCFIDQMPKGLRETLYIKDDDYAYSFIFGNYITLTNLNPTMLDKIISMKITPLYISVHTTNPVLRKQMMRYKQDLDILDVLKKLASGGIEYHTQLVLVPGMNDGAELEKSLKDLTSPELSTIGIGVVPVGLTKHRTALNNLPLYTKEQSLEVITIIDQHKEKFPAVYASDEFFIKAELPIPEKEYYGDFEEIENGIGMVRTMLDTWEYEKTLFAEYIKEDVQKDLLFITGVSAQHYLSKIVAELNTLIAPYKAEVKVIINKFMGPSATVCGLLTFEDITAQINLKENQIPVFSQDIFNTEGLTLDNFDSNYIKNVLERDILIVSPMFEDWEIDERINNEI
ncbi:MAG: DUF512 domain-containing protein [Candidatus Cloacimonadales bacterium]